MNLIQRAIDYERDGGTPAQFYALLSDCLAAGDLDGLVAVRTLFSGDHDNSGGDSDIKHRCSWALLRWGNDGLNELVSATASRPKTKNISACATTLTLIAGGTDRPQLVRGIDYDKEVAALRPLFNDLQLAGRRGLSRLFMLIKDDFDAAHAAAFGIQILSVHGDDAVREWFTALAGRWLAVGEPIICQYEQLIRDHPDNEPKFQEFLAANPQLLDPMAIDVWTLPQLNGAKEPDFIVRRTDDSYLVVEIEKPSKLLVTRDNHISAQATQAVSQASDYRDFINRMANPERFFPGLHDMECLVVVGLEAPLTSDQRNALRNDNRHRHGLRLVDFDWLAERARIVARNVTTKAVNVRAARTS